MQVPVPLQVPGVYTLVIVLHLSHTVPEGYLEQPPPVVQLPFVPQEVAPWSVQVTGVPAVQAPMLLQAPWGVNMLPLHEAVPQGVEEVGYTHVPLPLAQSVAPQVGSETLHPPDTQQCSGPGPKQMESLHWVPTVHTAPSVSLGTQEVPWQKSPVMQSPSPVQLVLQVVPPHL